MTVTLCLSSLHQATPLFSACSNCSVSLFYRKPCVPLGYGTKSINRIRCVPLTTAIKALSYIFSVLGERKPFLLPSVATHKNSFQSRFTSECFLKNKSVFYLQSDYPDGTQCPVKFFTDTKARRVTIHPRHSCSFNDDCVLIRF